jgi:hypothetical protein
MHLTENKIIYTLSVLLGSLLILMLVGIATGRSAGEEGPHNLDPVDYVSNFCFEGKVDQMDVEDLVKVYTKETNDYFNEKIKYIMTNPEELVPTPNLNEYGIRGGQLCMDSNNKEVSDMTCQAIAVCNPVNPGSGEDPQMHPFCIAMTLTGVAPNRAANYNWKRLNEIRPLKYSYFCYKAALERKRDAIFDSTPQAQLAKCGTEFGDEEICDLKAKIDAETNAQKKAELQLQMDNTLSGRNWWGERGAAQLSSLTATLVDLTGSTAKRVQFINEEMVRAKTALDQTVDAYSQLKTAWQMHVQYIDIFSELVKYRDHLVDVRKQTDTFPFRFIDATTTKCL